MSKHTYYYHQPPEPLQLTHTSTTSIPHVHADAYGPLASDPDPDPDAPLHRLLAQEDLALKHRIRLLRFLSRLVSALLAAITLSLLATTIEKFLLTRHTYYVVAGVRRTAWATDSVTWYTYMYAGVAAVSVVLDLAVLGCYAKDVRSANRAADIGSYWTYAVWTVQIVVWAVSAGVYRYGREPVDGKFKDLWGWTCSFGARELQDVLPSVEFARYCRIQTTSFYSGVVNVGMGVLTFVIFLYAMRRRRNKKRRLRMGTDGATEDLEPLRDIRSAM